MIKLKISESSLAKLRTNLEAQVNRAVTNVTRDIYKNIVSLDHRTDMSYGAEAPFWSGAFMNSWRVSSGYTNMSYAQPMTNGDSLVQYSAPNISNFNFTYSGNYAKVHISNNAPYAAKLETVGSPLHQHPWEVARHSVNVTVASFKMY